MHDLDTGTDRMRFYSSQWDAAEGELPMTAAYPESQVRDGLERLEKAVALWEKRGGRRPSGAGETLPCRRGECFTKRVLCGTIGRYHC